MLVAKAVPRGPGENFVVASNKECTGSSSMALDRSPGMTRWVSRRWMSSSDRLVQASSARARSLRRRPACRAAIALRSLALSNNLQAVTTRTDERTARAPVRSQLQPLRDAASGAADSGGPGGTPAGDLGRCKQPDRGAPPSPPPGLPPPAPLRRTLVPLKPACLPAVSETAVHIDPCNSCCC